MRVVTAFRRWFSPQAPRSAAAPRTPPVALDLHHHDPDEDLDAFDPSGPGTIGAHPRRSRQELITELQRNYQEVLGIVRKVDNHLDQQSERAERVAVIAERFPRAADDLAQMRVRQEQAGEIMDALAHALNARDERIISGQSTQLERLDEVRDLLAESGQAQRQLVGALIEFRDIIGGLAGATDKLTDAVTHIEQRDAERAADFLDALTATRKWAIALSIIVGACGLIAIAVATIR